MAPHREGPQSYNPQDHDFDVLVVIEDTMFVRRQGGPEGEYVVTTRVVIDTHKTTINTAVYTKDAGSWEQNSAQVIVDLTGQMTTIDTIDGNVYTA